MAKFCFGFGSYYCQQRQQKKPEKTAGKTKGYPPFRNPSDAQQPQQGAVVPLRLNLF